MFVRQMDNVKSAVIKIDEENYIIDDAVEVPSHDQRPQNPPDDDITTKVIGDFGRWQFCISILMTLLKLPSAWYQLNIIFMAPPQDYWCKKPTYLTKFTEEEWRYICSPLIEEHPCLVYDPELLQFYPDVDTAMIPLVTCKQFVYNDTVFKRTIISDWNLVCSKHWLIHLTQCTIMWGFLIGGIIFGILADKYGRKNPLMVGIVLQSLFSYIVSFMSNFWWFLANWFILSLSSGGVGIISFVICMEVVSGKYRTIMPVLYQIPFGIGNTIMSLLAYWLRDWRLLEIALATLSALFILYWFILPESPRWLLATGQVDKAIVVLKNAAAFNKMTFNKSLIEAYKPKQQQKNPGFLDFLRSKKMRMRTVLLSLNWFCSGLSFYTFSQYVGLIATNTFLVIGLTGALSTFGGIACLFVITNYGRKITVAVFQFLSALCFFFLLVIPKDSFSNDWPRLLCAGIGFAGMAGYIPALYLFSGELYPTLGRNIGISGVTMFARIASMMAPGVVSLDSIIADLPLILLAVMSFAQILLLLPLPETKGINLPDTLEDAEKFSSRH